jgi:ABC-type branched-subunit amino acid transport system ATPase component
MRIAHNAPLLTLEKVDKRFGGLLVVREMAFSVGRGEIVSLIGPNGAGKTTVLNLITGLYKPDAGRIVFDGADIGGLSMNAISRRGISRTFQTLRLFLNMSVIENVMAVAYARTQAQVWDIVLRTPQFRREEAQIRAKAEEKLAFFGSRLQGYRFDQPAYSLSYANRRRLEIARAMMTEPTLLLLDEPAAGMNPNETLEITDLIGDLRRRGQYTILIIEHDMAVIEGVSDRVIALDYGEKIAEGSYAEVVSNARVIEAYLGRQHGNSKSAQRNGD